MPLSLESGPVVFLSSDDLMSAIKSVIFVDHRSAVELSACHFPMADSGIELRALIESFLL
jgi:hypothetical protein